MNETEYKGKLKTLTNWLLQKRISKQQFEEAKSKLLKAYQESGGRVVTPEDVKEIFNQGKLL